MSNFVVKPSRNPIVQAAFAGLERERRAEKKSAKPADTEEIATPHAARVKRPSTSVKPAVKKTNAKPPRAKGGKPGEIDE